MNDESIAYLSNDGAYTIFSFRDTTITFLTAKNLEYYTEVLLWDNGYIEVTSKNTGHEPIEEYIDLVPILENLLINPDDFCGKIKEVKIKMSDAEKIKIADSADMIVKGYAFERIDENIRIVNLNINEPHVMLIDKNGIPIESSMTPIEQRIALDIWLKDSEYMEAADA